MDNTGKLVLFGTVALAVLFIRRAVGGSAAPIKETTLERQVMRHRRLIWEAGLKHDVDPALIAAIMAVESSGIHQGARQIVVTDYTGMMSVDYVVGLMQIRLDTASAYCQIPDAITLELDAINVDCGVKYLRAMIDRFFYQGGIPDAVSAYNAGPGNVRPGGPSMVGGMQYVNLSYIRRVLGMVARFRLLFMGSQGAAVYMQQFPGNKWRFEIP